MEKQTNTDTSEYDIYIGCTYEDYIDMMDEKYSTAPTTEAMNE